METKDINARKKKLEMDIHRLIAEFEKDTDILCVDKVYVSKEGVRTELRVNL